MPFYINMTLLMTYAKSGLAQISARNYIACIIVTSKDPFQILCMGTFNISHIIIILIIIIII